MKKKANSRPKMRPEQQQPLQSSSVEHQEKFSLYAILQVDSKATKDEIKKQYRKLVIQYHPDKNKEDDNKVACQKFQKLQEAYQILIDDEKRQLYDQTGQIGDQNNQAAFQSAYQYFRKMFKPFTQQDIEDFAKTYRHAKMEEQDLLDYYHQHEGDMRALLQHIPLSTDEDIPRFITFFEAKISTKEIENYKNFNLTKKKVRKLPNEEKQFEEEQKKKDFNSLVLAIKGKNHQNLDFIQSLEEKYGPGKKKKVDKKKK